MGAVKGVTRSITAEDANQVCARAPCSLICSPFAAIFESLQEASHLLTSPSPLPLRASQFVPVMGFECRGLEPVSYRPDVFIVKSKGGQTFEADLSEGCAKGLCHTHACKPCHAALPCCAGGTAAVLLFLPYVPVLGRHCVSHALPRSARKAWRLGLHRRRYKTPNSPACLPPLPPSSAPPPVLPQRVGRL